MTRCVFCDVRAAPDTTSVVSPLIDPQSSPVLIERGAKASRDGAPAVVGRNPRGGRLCLRLISDKASTRPIANELLEILRSAVEDAALPSHGQDCVIPKRRAASVRMAERQDNVFWETISDLGER